MRGDLRRRQHRRGRQAGGAQRVHGALARAEGVEPLADDRQQRRPVLAPGQRRGEARVVLEVGPLHGLQQPGPELRPADGLHREVPARERVDHHAGARPGIGVAAVDNGAVGDVLGGDHRLQHRHVQVRPAAGAPVAEQRGQDGAEGVRAGQHVGRLQVAHRRRRARLLLHVHDAGHRVDDVVERGRIAQRAGLAEAGDRAVDDVGLHARERGVIDAQPRGHAGHEVLDRHVGLAREVQRHLAPARVAEIEPDALLAHVDAHEVRGLVEPTLLELDVPPARFVPFAGPLDLEHARAEVGQQACAVGPCQHAGEVEDGETVEQPGRVSHGRDPPERVEPPRRIRDFLRGRS